MEACFKNGLFSLTSMDHKIHVTLTYKYYELTHSVMFNKHLTYDVNP